MAEPETRHRICPICEVTCGLEVETKGREIGAIRGNKDDAFSRGYICPKGVALRELDTDPDRLRKPLVRRNGELVETSWDEAFAEVEARITPILEQHGRPAVGLYLGNPSAHKVGLQLYLANFSKALSTPNRYSASTLDQMPKQVSNGLMFGHILTAAVPDIDRCEFLVILGANPMASNGSLWTVPDFRGRARAMQRRGGKLIVIDPKRTQTAKLADQHIPIRPGTDAYFLAAVAHTLFEEELVDLGDLQKFVEGVAEARAAVENYSPETVVEITGIDATVIRELARNLAAAPRAAVYGRIGTCTQEFGTLTSWLVDVLNVLTGNLDTPGGAMFPKAVAFQGNASGDGGVGAGVRFGRYRSRVRGASEILGEFPAVCLAEEIENPGEGQIRALFTVAGNPVLSAPNGDRLARALGQLDFMVSVDIYLNETTRFADVILPGTSFFEECQFDIGFNQFSIRNTARFSPAMFPPEDGRPLEWEIMARLASIVSGQNMSVEEADDLLIMRKIQGLTQKPGGLIEGRDPDEIFDALKPRRGPERQIDLAIRVGPHGDGFGIVPEGLTLQQLIDDPNGIDFGALEPRMPEILRTPSGMIELAPAALIDDMERLKERLGRMSDSEFLLVGRRDVRTNNSWLHNLPILAKGPFRCTMQIHPGDANRLGIEDGSMARVSRDGRGVDVEAELTDDMMPGVISIPHGFGHNHQGTNLNVASERPGVNSNILANDDDLDPMSGTAILNGIPVKLAALV